MATQCIYIEFIRKEIRRWLSMKLSQKLRLIWKHKSLFYRRHETRRRNASKLQRRRELIALEGKCRKCGTTKDLTIDHIIPMSKGGSRQGLHNMQVLCTKCNRYKADKLYEVKDKS